jgi:site-specific DNA recombinase
MQISDQPFLFDFPAVAIESSQTAPGADQMAAWATLRGPSTASRPGPGTAGLRFAFYGRVSTTEYQDEESSLGWQRESALDLIGPAGRIVVEFFDVGCSRRLAWSDRPQARRLLQALPESDRGFDAIVVGESERAFCAGQLPAMVPMFAASGVQIWLPELDGPLNPDSTPHQVLVLQLGAQSRREVLRARFRTTAAMRAQARDQGRYLGGRPPYGYRLVDAGAHPNRAHARWGRRMQRLDPDPRTAEHVKWIFDERRNSRSVASIARALNDARVPCPSSADSERNSHRHREIWTNSSVAAILANPRYTGHQVWNRQRTEHVPVSVPTPDGASSTVDAGGRYGRRRVQRWNPKEEWVISAKIAHPPLVSPEDFLAVQGLRTSRSTSHGTRRIYMLSGLLRCRLCGHRMDSHWVNDRPGYRCRHGHTSAHPAGNGHRPYLYVREDDVLTDLLASPALAEHAHDPQEAVRLLRHHKITIDCDSTTCALSATIPTS